MRRRRLLVLAVVAAVAVGILVWRHQGRLIGAGARWWLSRVAAGDGDGLSRRRGVLEAVHRTLLLAPPAEVHVAELFELTTQLSGRVASGDVSMPWAAWIYTAWARDLVRDRPTGAPGRGPDEVAAELARVQQYYAIRERPDVPGITAADLFGTGDDVITLEEIERAERDGTPIDLRTRGAPPGS